MPSSADSPPDPPEHKAGIVSYLLDHAPMIYKRRQKYERSQYRTGSWLNRFLQSWNVSRSLENKLAIILAAACAISGLATYAALTETPPLGNNPDTVIWLLNLDLILLTMLAILISRRIVSLWSGRRRGLAGSDLHVRLVYTFSLLAAVPAIIMTVFSALFFHFGVQTWFSERVETAINESQAVAEAYLEEHKQVIRADTMAMANDIDRQAGILANNARAFEQVMQTQSFLRNLSEAIVFESDRDVLARSGLTFTLEYADIPQHVMRRVNEGEVAVITGDQVDRVRALVKLDNFIDTYLFVGRMVDPKVLSHLYATQQASADYADLQSRYSSLQITVTLIFVVVGLLLVLAAIWLGLVLARQMVSPISNLISTADRVRSGDLTARVPEGENIEAFDYLARAFNRMTRQIHEQQSELLSANRQLDHRRRFTETILTGVSSGVIGVDARGAINMANTSARDLLEQDGDAPLEGQNILALIPEIEEVLEKAHKRPEKITQIEIPFMRQSGRRTYLVRIAVELIDDQDVGAILTFDDITELQSAQRKAAWADVARRIAHEIKNPLTPIQLSAERLKRKYLGQIKEDRETFAQCTETIIKQVDDIGRMVSEFSAFARMPEPVMSEDNLSMHVREVLVLYRQAHPGIRFDLISGSSDQDFRLTFDSQQIRQALNNLIQNAVDSIEIQSEEKGKTAQGLVQIYMSELKEEEKVLIAVSDTGPGLPEEEQSSLTEPYITHKPKGTGLGLAIVKKIMEDHNGDLILGIPHYLAEDEKWKNPGGATVILELSRNLES